MSEYLDEGELRERSLLAEIAALKAENERLEWDLAHYRDMLLLRCGVTAAELTPISSTLRIARGEPAIKRGE